MNITPTYTAEIRYKMQPPVGIFCSLQARGAKYNNLDLNEDELVADSDDEIGFIAYVTRKDDKDKKQLKGATITRVDLIVDNATETPAFDYEVVFDDDTKPGKFGKLAQPAEKVKGVVRSKKAMYYTSENDVKLKLVFYATFEGGGVVSKDEKILIPSESAVIYPKLLKLFMWVLPGKEIYTSEIWATIRLLPKPQRSQNWKEVQGFKLFARIVDGSGWASFESVDDIQETQRKYYAFALWKLRYTKITWENMIDADVAVQVSLYSQRLTPGQQPGLVYYFNVGQNMNSFINDFRDNIPNLNLYNPYFDEIKKDAKEFMVGYGNNADFGSKTLASKTEMTEQDIIDSKKFLTDLAMGPMKPVYDYLSSDKKLNILVAFLESVLPYSKGALNDSLNFINAIGDTYLCAEIAGRVFEWAAKQKFGEPLHPLYDKQFIENAQRMNGIEISKSAISRLHVYFGFYPSNPDVYAKYIDPWWEQNIDPHDFVTTIENELGKGTALTTVGMGYAAVLATMTGIAPTFLAAFIATLKLVVIAIPSGMTLGSVVEGKNYFRFGEVREDYMRTEKNMYDSYGGGGILSGWPGKIINATLLEDDQYHDPASLVSY